MTQRKQTIPAPSTAVTIGPTAAKQATGTENLDLQKVLVDQAMNTLWGPADLSDHELSVRARAALAVLRGIEPRDELEGLLAAQMVGAHNAAMECFKRAMDQKQSFEARNMNLKHAERLTALYTRQLEALDNRRGRGQHKVSIRDVHVQSGGQAIVGNVQSASAPQTDDQNGGGPAPLASDPNGPVTVDATVGTRRKRAP